MAQIDETIIVKALAKITDPHTGKDLITANMIRDLAVENNNVSFTVELPNLNAPYKSDLNFACQQAILEAYPEANVHVHMMSRQPAAGAPPAGPPTMPGVRNVIAVASGKGGVGKSTVAVNLALGLQALGAKVGLLDADLYGPSLPTMLGLVGRRPKVQQVGGQSKIVPLEAYGMPVISLGVIIEPEQAVVLRGPRLSGVIKQFFNETLWPPLDYLVVDLPPGTGDVQLTLVQTVPVTGVVMVTTPQEVALADAIKAMNMFLLPSVNVPILGVVENMAWFTPADLPDRKYLIFGEGGGKKLAKLSQSMLLGQIPLVQGVREGGDRGLPAMMEEANPTREAFLHVARNAARQIALRNELMEPTRRVNMEP